jgi:hypothetical protein
MNRAEVLDESGGVVMSMFKIEVVVTNPKHEVIETPPVTEN